MLQVIGGDDHIKSLDIELAHPSEEVRITPVKDVIEPRVKVEGPGGIFPGVLSKVDTVGTGRTHALKNVAVVTAGKIVGFQEGIIDMTGPGAEYTPFSQLHNIVVVAEPQEGIKQHDQEAALRMIGLKSAQYIGEFAKNLEPDEIKHYETEPILDSFEKYPDLPK